MDVLTIEKCRFLINQGEHLSDDQIEAVRAEIYMLAGVVVDAWDSIESVDQTKFNPPGKTLMDRLTEDLGPWPEGLPVEDHQ